MDVTESESQEFRQLKHYSMIPTLGRSILLMRSQYRISSIDRVRAAIGKSIDNIKP